MARNKTKYIDEISINYESQSKYILYKNDIINRKYNSLFLKDVVCTTNGYVMGVCDCDCGNKNIVTAIKKLITYQTESCGCSRSKGTGFNSIYNSDKYVGKIYKNLKVLSYYFGESGVFWKTQCIICGTVKDFKASHVVNGTTTSCGCVLHNRNNKYSSDEWVGKDIDGTIILSIADKTTDGQMWICKCKYCNNKFKAKASKIVHRHTNSCGCITESIGIIEICKYLDSLENIYYVKEWTSTELLSQYGYKLRIDIALFKDSKLIAFIEYDGNQHYELNANFGPVDKKEKLFLDIIDSDNRKDSFALSKNIPLLRVKYNRNSKCIIDEVKSFINKLKL